MKHAPELPEVTLSEHEGVRCLHLGTPWVQGAMRVARPRAIELDYVQRMLAALLWLPQEDLAQGRAVQLGLGAAALTRFTHAELGMDTTAIELNPQVILACRAHFRLPADGAGLQVVCGDAAQWVARPPRGYTGSVRLLHVDLYDHEAAAPVLDSADFYAHCRQLLTDDGAMTVNLFGRNASYAQSLEKICTAFGSDAVWAFKPTREGNTVVLALRTPQHATRMELLARAEAVQARWGLPATKWLRVFKAVQGSA